MTSHVLRFDPTKEPMKSPEELPAEDRREIIEQKMQYI